ncbi:MAG: FHA domain-containing protein [Lentisphaerae bacterium]|jgi:pSer/pThr/pTyr-binding forkhead associated (FHA) protein|nr:FHA domain-containing protein [Lentisphaerota bacterium]MBT4815500.1 FHA domain-containing protein [Lentisphaerota bacterium]MBT5604893.1 FHA domain-containing protein [Lentisphaerota bacterium]MBT7054867.1 FHA domain-containing protein [Lentisphaerota bacterium]MBT7842691.1 FHA domain-containing protein [Lentisphaerota bacterium]
MLCLTVERGEPRGSVYQLHDDETIVAGRSRQKADLWLGDSGISGRHLRLTAVRGSLEVEDLDSKSGTLLEGEPLTAPTRMELGQRLSLGGDTVLLLTGEDEPTEAPQTMSPTAGTSAPLGDGERITGPPTPPTGVGGEADAERETCPPDGADLKTEGEDEDTETRDLLGDDNSPEWRISDTEDGLGKGDGTIVWKTPTGDPEDERWLIAQERRKAHVRHALILALTGALLAALTYGLRPPTARKPLTWPRSSTGTYRDSRFVGPGGGYAIVCPEATDSVLKEEANESVISFTLDGVEFRLVISEDTNDSHVRTDIADCVAAWIGAMESDDSWGAEQLSAFPTFFGKGNGIPARHLRYSHTVNSEGWSGICYFCRHGRRLITVRVETPDMTRALAEDLMLTIYLEPDEEFEHLRWEGASDDIPTPAEELVEDAGKAVSGSSPLTWTGAEKTVIRAIRKAAQEGDTALEAKAIGHLDDLRTRQRIWFSGQQIRRDEAEKRGDKETQAAIKARCEGVFSNKMDHRYHLVRKWK